MTSPSYSEHPAILKAKAQAKGKISITQTFVLAHKARSKLSKEASKPDHDLRHLVLTANLLDSLMLHLSNAEQDQEAWFNGMVREDNHDESETKAPTPSLDAITEESELAWTSEDYSDSSDSDSDDEDIEDEEEDVSFGGYPMLALKPLSSQRVPSITIEVTADTSDEEDDSEDEEDDGFYSLRRMPSRAQSLIEDSSDSDEEDSSPPSPRESFAVPILTHKERQSLVTTSFYEEAVEAENSPVAYLDRSIHIQQSASLVAAY